MASIPYLPPEIIIRILGFADKKMLLACCLVQKDWLPIARECLYGTIKFRSSEFTESFLQCLPNLSPDVAAYVRRIDLGNPDSLFWSPDRIRRITEHFHHVKELTLLYLDFTVFDDLFGSLTNFQEVEVLSVSDTAFKDSIQLLRFVSSFPALTAVALEWCTFSNSEAALPQPPIPLPVNLRKGVFSYCRETSVIRWFIDHARSVMSLDLPDLEAHQFKQFGTDLKNIGDDLEHFSLMLDYHELSKDLTLLHGCYQQIPLSYNTKLRSLSFTSIDLSLSGMSVDNPQREGEKRDDFSWFTSWLRTISSFHLARISIDFYFHDLNGLSLFPWADIDAILSTFPSLGEMALCFTPIVKARETAPESDMVVQYVKDSLPLLCSKKQILVDIEIEDALDALADLIGVSDSEDESELDFSDNWEDDDFDADDFNDDDLSD